MSSCPLMVRTASLAAPAPIVAREIPAGSNVDEATLKTVQQMAEYVRQSMHDPLIQAAARRAVDTFGLGGSSDQAKLWAVFWWIKHVVKFESDENTLLRLGRRDEQDLLISPSVLLRMRRPKEDCDGFSMLAACMLACEGVPVGLVAVAVDPDEPERWSHVFCIAQVDGEVVPIDASHGLWPGWMVPRSRISRWQAFNLDGQPIDVQMPASRFRGLHGFLPSSVPMTRRGMGEDDETFGLFGDDPFSGASGGSNVSLQFPFASGAPPAGGGGVTQDANGNWLTASGQLTSFPSPTNTVSYPPGSVPAGSSTPSWLASLVNNSFGLATKVLAPNYQSTYVRDPVTGQLVQTTTVRSGAVPGTSLLGSPTGAGISPTLMLVGVGLLALVGLAASSSKGRG